MFRQVIVLILFCLCGVRAYGQTADYNAPVKWERYKVGEREVSVLFPKLPVVIENSNFCNEEEGAKYAAYAEGVVYGLSITYKTKQKDAQFGCGEKRKFSERSFSERIKEVKSELKTSDETKVRKNGFDAVRIKGNLFSYWFINDFKNKRWFELWTTKENENVPNIKNFVESLKIGQNPQGIEIADGSKITLGDESAISEEAVSINEDNKTDTSEVRPLRIIAKPRASYTDAARKNQTNGTVRVRVTFTASGGVGKIYLIDALPFGLAEQAIAAAKKIVFIPAKKNGVSVSVSKLVEYSFVIY